jgi:hypothetical protein
MFAVLGICTALGHHFYNQSLSGTAAGNTGAQQWVIWIATGFTNTTIFFLNSSMPIAFVQSIWFAVKRRAFSVSSVDRLFGVDRDIKALFDRELWGKAIIGVVIAFVIW